MDEDTIVLLYEKFLKIKRMGWILSKRRGPGGIGYTFETLLGKEEDNFYIPDFYGIEIKTMRKRSRREIHLMTITPDGDFLFPIKRILNILGYPSKWDRTYKVLGVTLNATQYSKIGYSKMIKLIVNHEQSKVAVKALNHYGDNLDIYTSWSFDLLKERLEAKLSYLALIQADNIINDGLEYFKYYDFILYRLKGFDEFINLIEEGIVKVTFNIDVYKDEKRKGQIYDHGTYFSLNIKDLEKLFEEIKIDSLVKK